MTDTNARAATARVKKHKVSAEYRFWLLDPEGDGMQFFLTTEARDDASKEAIQAYLDDGWSEEVVNVVAGEVTHLITATNVVKRPENIDEDDHDEDGEHWPEGADFKCDYELVAIARSERTNVDSIVELLREARTTGDLAYHGGDKNNGSCLICAFCDRVDAALKNAAPQVSSRPDSGGQSSDTDTPAVATLSCAERCHVTTEEERCVDCPERFDKARTYGDDLAERLLKPVQMRDRGAIDDDRAEAASHITNLEQEVADRTAERDTARGLVDSWKPIVEQASRATNKRWTQIQEMSAAVAASHEAPTELESALCGAVVRAQQLERELAEERERADMNLDHCKRAEEDAATARAASNKWKEEIARLRSSTAHPSATDIAGAVARGWCSPLNEHKVMDPELAFAITAQIVALLGTRSATSNVEPNEALTDCRRALDEAVDALGEINRVLRRYAKDDDSFSASSNVEPRWPDPEDWDLVCPKCGSNPIDTCGWPSSCPTGLNTRDSDRKKINAG